MLLPQYYVENSYLKNTNKNIATLGGFFTPKERASMEHEQLKHVVDFASIGVAFATLVSWLPSIAALVSIVWGLIRIYETETVKKWTGR
jgi:hypothetical protein